MSRSSPQTNKEARFSLPEKLDAHLPDSRVAGAGHITKLAAVEVPRRVVELGVVEKVEKLGAELDGHALAYPSVLGDLLI